MPAPRLAARRLLMAVALGIALGAVLWWPAASLAVLMPPKVSCEQWSGSLWSGRCAGLSIDGSRSGNLDWSLRRPRLNTLTLPVQLTWRAGDSNAEAIVLLTAQRPSPSLPAFEQLRLHLALQTLRSVLPSSMRLGPLASLEGWLETRDLQLHFDAMGTAQPRGELRLQDARWLRDDLALGDLLAEFQALDATQARTDAKSPGGMVRDLGGPLSLEGKINFAPAGAYRADFRLEARSPSAAQALGIVAPLEVTLEGRL